MDQIRTNSWTVKANGASDTYVYTDTDGDQKFDSILHRNNLTGKTDLVSDQYLEQKSEPKNDYEAQNLYNQFAALRDVEADRTAKPYKYVPANNPYGIGHEISPFYKAWDWIKSKL